MYSLLMSHKKDDRLEKVNKKFIVSKKIIQDIFQKIFHFNISNSIFYDSKNQTKRVKLDKTFIIIQYIEK